MASAATALWRRHVRWIKPHEDAFARAYRALMGDLREQIRTSGTKPFNLKQWQAEAVETMAPVYRQSILAGGREFLTGTISIRQKIASGALTKAKKRTSDLVVSLESQFADRLAETITTTYDALGSVLKEAVADNLDANEIGDLIDEEWDDILGPRTDAIALTETNGAVNSVRDYLMRELVELQKWITSEDDRVRTTHRIYGDAGVKPVGFDWATLIPDAGYILRYPGDPECHEPGEIVNCRCFNVPAGELELDPADLKDYLDDFDMDPEDVMLSEDQTPAYVVNAYLGKGVQKHLPGQHDQQDHNPYGGSKSDIAVGVEGGTEASYNEIHGPLRGRASKAELAALDSYATTGYEKINSGLRRGGKASKTVRAMDALFARAGSLSEGTEAFRGVSGALAKKLSALQVGDEFSDKGYVSTSFSRTVSQGFATEGGLLLRVWLPAGTRALPGVKAEREAILPRGSRFRVIATNPLQVELAQ